MEPGTDAARRITGYGEKFDRLFEMGARAVRAGTHHRDSPPVDGGRWGVSVILPPDRASTARLAEATSAAMSVAGRHHWPTGSPDAAHVTVRALEAHRTAARREDPLVARGAAALRRTAAACRPVRLDLRGLTLTPSGIMACAYPVDPAATDFAARLAKELGADGWFEADFNRDIWYATLVHFTGPVADPEALVDWVARRRTLDLGRMTTDVAELLRWRFNGRQPVRVSLATESLGVR
ncbi:hypothetical protein [Plantactinospora sp. GCM10030261]|uniref:hypothetical protein n=1 Tax=Plantactinospora sp. GCM10030261 TaxID=3273420 RepID=UPI00361B3B68